MKKIWILLFLLFLPHSSVSAFVLGLKSTDNTVEDFVRIEKTYHLYLPIVSFIYDPWEQQDVVSELEKMKAELGNNRIYHISVSPNQFSAEEVANGAFDEEYKTFFQTIKRLNMKVIFRTMHEMNGGRYPRSSNPEAFKKAWIHVWRLSRSVGLNKHDILFDFSVNHRDMPTLGKPSQQAQLIQCKVVDPLKKELEKLKKKQNLTQEEKLSLKAKEKELELLNQCFRFEDYFPGETYVDLVGVTFYNRGKATSNRLWKTPQEILNNPEWNTLERLKALGKPLFIDEVGTTAVWYPGSYDPEFSRQVYLSTGAALRKDLWLKQLSELLQEHHFVGSVYFNVDYTQGLTHPTVGEADWAIINMDGAIFYKGFWDLYAHSQADFSSLLDAFGLVSFTLNDKQKLVPKIALDDLKFIDSLVNEKVKDSKKKSELYLTLLLSPTGKESFDRAIQILAEEYQYAE